MFKFDKKNYILYLLNKLEPKVSLLRINKIAFLVEFAYIFNFGEELTDISYAALPYGPVINDYNKLFEEMSLESYLVYDRDARIVRPLKDSEVTLSLEIEQRIEPFVEWFKSLKTNDLIQITHSLDSYIITSESETKMGRIIDKALANLDIYFDKSLSEEDTSNTTDLPYFDKSDLVPLNVK